MGLCMTANANESHRWPVTSHVEMARKQAYTHKRNQGFFGLAIDRRQGFFFPQGLLSGFVFVKALILLALHENHANSAA